MLKDSDTVNRPMSKSDSCYDDLKKKFKKLHKMPLKFVFKILEKST
jgi:hypothetical protein